jgi:hypothetical protein
MTGVFVITRCRTSRSRVGCSIKMGPSLLNVCFCTGQDANPSSRGVCILDAIIRLFMTDVMRELGKILDFDSVVPFSLNSVIALLYLHRTYLVEALSRWPEDPVHSRFGLSVVAVHRSSLIVLQGFHRIREHFTVLLPRIIGVWLQVGFAQCSTYPH